MPWRDLEIPSDDEMRKLRQEFRGRARFLVDENAGDEVAELLRGQGYNDTWHSQPANRRTKPVDSSFR
jgi:hypothetical protein